MAKFFLDSASLNEIDEIFKMDIVSGLTTNPTLLKSESFDDVLSHLKKIVSILNQHGGNIPFSVQVMTSDVQLMVEQADLLYSELKYKELVIKIPCGWNELKVMNTLMKKKYKINCTACITSRQVALASSLGVQYISLFLGKARDAGIDANSLVGKCMRSIIEDDGKNKSKLIVGSIREIADVETAILGGADIITVRAKVLKDVIQHSKTLEAINAFSNDFIPFNS